MQIFRDSAQLSLVNGEMDGAQSVPSHEKSDCPIRYLEFCGIALKTLLEYSLWTIAKVKASVRSVSASYADFLYTKKRIAHSQNEKSFATLWSKDAEKCVM